MVAIQDATAGYVGLARLESTDGTQLRRFFYRLSPETLYRRFHSPIARPEQAQPQRLLDLDHHDREAVVAVVGGEIVGVVGESGSGKSVTAYTVMGLNDQAAEITNGRITMGGIDLLAARRDIHLVALFGPEHGVRGDAADRIGNATDPKTGLPVYSLFGSTRRPTPAMLRNLDALVFDIQDTGARFYTYISTLALTMQAAAANGLLFVVLDRPNPLGGQLVDGPVLDPKWSSFIGMYPIPVLPGMTMGELAGYFILMVAAGEGHLLNLSIAARHQRSGHGRLGLVRAEQLDAFGDLHVDRHRRRPGQQQSVIEVGPDNGDRERGGENRAEQHNRRPRDEPELGCPDIVLADSHETSRTGRCGRRAAPSQDRGPG